MGKPGSPSRRVHAPIASVTDPEPKPDPADEPVVDWEDFERTSALLIKDQRPPEEQPVSSRQERRRPSI